MLTPARAARLLALALPLPTIAGLATALLAGSFAARDDEDSALVIVTVLALVGGIVALTSHLAAALAARALLRAKPFEVSVWAEPARTLGALRPLGALALVGGAFVPALRAPLVGVSLALLDAAFVLALFSASQAALGAQARRALWVGIGYAIVRVSSALAVVASEDAHGVAWVVHRLLGALAAAAVALVCVALSRVLAQDEA